MVATSINCGVLVGENVQGGKARPGLAGFRNVGGGNVAGGWCSGSLDAASLRVPHKTPSRPHTSLLAVGRMKLTYTPVETRGPLCSHEMYLQPYKSS